MHSRPSNYILSSFFFVNQGRSCISICGQTASVALRWRGRPAVLRQQPCYCDVHHQQTGIAQAQTQNDRLVLCRLRFPAKAVCFVFVSLCRTARDPLCVFTSAYRVRQVGSSSFTQHNLKQVRLTDALNNAWWYINKQPDKNTVKKVPKHKMWLKLFKSMSLVVWAAFDLLQRWGEAREPPDVSDWLI